MQLLLPIALSTVGAVAVVHGAPPSVADFAQGAHFFAPSISPDGSMLVHLTHSVDGRRAVAVRKIGEGAGTAIMSGEAGAKGSFLATGCWFKNDQRIVCHFDGFDFDGGRPYPISRLVSVNRDGSDIKVLVQRGASGASQ
ncbi:MAG: hypothetical protein IT481_01920, partial [Gammaproteobacteria bacterium]|nr:hypothetical protein [Gammaproteobacteria bacterium]